MQDFIDFIIKYWYLSGPFVLSFILLIIEEARGKDVLSKINAQQATRLMNQEQALVLDIRTKQKFKEGHILGAINIPQAELLQKKSKLEQNKEKSIIVVCPDGQQSGTVAVQLRKQGFLHAVSLSGGMRAWQQEHMPVVLK